MTPRLSSLRDTGCVDIRANGHDTPGVLRTTGESGTWEESVDETSSVILIVDDHPTNLELLFDLLDQGEDWG